MFYYKTSFSKKAVFLEETAENHFVWKHDRFEGRGRLGTKINVTFFVGIDVLNILHLTTFSKKTIFSKITVKNYSSGSWPFLRERALPDDKNEYNLILENGVPNTVLKFFPKKPYMSDLNPKNWFWGHIFPHICGSVGPIVSKKL